QSQQLGTRRRRQSHHSVGCRFDCHGLSIEFGRPRRRVGYRKMYFHRRGCSQIPFEVGPCWVVTEGRRTRKSGIPAFPGSKDPPVASHSCCIHSEATLEVLTVRIGGPEDVANSIISDRLPNL